MKKMLLILTMLLSASVTAAEPLEQKLDAWETVNVQGKFHDLSDEPTRFTWSVETQPHVGFKPTPTLDSVENFANVGYKLDYDLAVALGGGWITTFPEQVLHPLGEVRLYEQASYTPTFGPIGAVTRVRVEERFKDSGNVSTRVRWLIRANWNLAECFALVASNEIFINALTSDVKPIPNFFDQDRAFVGARFKISPNFGVEMGYQPTLENEALRHVILTSLLITVD